MKSVDTLIEKALAYTPSLKKKDKERKAAMPQILAKIAKFDQVVADHRYVGIEIPADQPKDLTWTERGMLSRVKFIHKLVALVNGNDFFYYFFYSRFQKYPQSERRRFTLSVPYLRNHFFEGFSRRASESAPRRIYLNLWTGVVLTVDAGTFSAAPAYNRGFSCSTSEMKEALSYFLSRREDRAIAKGFTKYGPYWAYTVTMYLRSDEETRRLLIEGFEGNSVFMSKKIVSMIFSRKAPLKENLKVLKTAVRMSKKEFAQIHTEEDDFLVFCKRMSRLGSTFRDPEFLTLALGKSDVCRKAYNLHSDLSKVKTNFTKPELLALCLVAVYHGEEKTALKLKKLPWIYHRYLSNQRYADIKGTESLYRLDSMEGVQGIKPFQYKEKNNNIQMFSDIVRMFLNMRRRGTDYIIDFSHGLQRAHDRIVEEQNKAEILGLSDTKPKGLYDPFIVHECFTPLETHRALAIEGKEMKHCVGTYIHRITPKDGCFASGSSVYRQFSQIYAVSWRKERATLELGVVIKLDRPPRQINEVILNRLQLFGPCNQETSEEMREFVDSIIADARYYLGFLLHLGYREMTDY